MLRRVLADSRRVTSLGATRVPTITTLPPPLSPLQHRAQHTDDRSIVKVLNVEEGAGLMVDAFSQLGFRLNNGLSIVGPVALFPKTVLSWRINGSEDINEDSLSLFYMLDPKIDLLVLGVGDKGNTISTSVIQFMKQKGINLEILPTESACTTFNFLNQERRCVAAGLIPPYRLTTTSDDLLAAQRRTNTLFRNRMKDD